MMSVRIYGTIALWALAGVFLIVAACGGDDDNGGATQTSDVSGAVITGTGDTTPRARKTATPSPTPSATPLDICAPNPDPAPANLLQILEPKPGEQVQVPVHVRGWSSTIGTAGTISLGVVDARQNAVQAINLPAEPRDFRIAPPGLDVTPNTYPFAADIVLNDVTAPTPYCLWAYLGVDAEGHAKQVVQVPVIFLPRQ